MEFLKNWQWFAGMFGQEAIYRVITGSMRWTEVGDRISIVGIGDFRKIRIRVIGPH